jgi:hypothetical protein
MRENKVRHIVVKKFDEGYGQTLCGRYVQVCVSFYKYGDADYFKRERPDCQDCLRKHFQGKSE